jgi:hypothetical protein
MTVKIDMLYNVQDYVFMCEELFNPYPANVENMVSS